MEPITQRDLLNYKFLSSPRFAPGGQRAAFVVASSNEEENNYERRLWLFENGSLRQLTDLGQEGSFLWLDQDRLIFPAVRSAKEKKRAEAKEAFTAYYVLDLRGGEALPYMTLPKLQMPTSSLPASSMRRKAMTELSRSSQEIHRKPSQLESFCQKAGLSR